MKIFNKTNPEWEANDTFSPAAVLMDGKICVLYRAEDLLYPDKDVQQELEWNNKASADSRVAVVIANKKE